MMSKQCYSGFLIWGPPEGMVPGGGGTPLLSARHYLKLHCGPQCPCLSCPTGECFSLCQSVSGNHHPLWPQQPSKKVTMDKTINGAKTFLEQSKEL